MHVKYQDAGDGLRCEGVIPILKTWMDGELDSRRASAVGRHVAGCGACAKVADDYAEISHRLRRLAEEDAPEIPTRLLWPQVQKFRLERLRQVRFLQRVAAAAAVVLAGSVGFLLWQGSGARDDPDVAGRIQQDQVMEIVLSSPSWGREY